MDRNRPEPMTESANRHRSFVLKGPPEENVTIKEQETRKKPANQESFRCVKLNMMLKGTSAKNRADAAHKPKEHPICQEVMML